MTTRFVEEVCAVGLLGKLVCIASTALPVAASGKASEEAVLDTVEVAAEAILSFVTPVALETVLASSRLTGQPRLVAHAHAFEAVAVLESLTEKVRAAALGWVGCGERGLFFVEQTNADSVCAQLAHRAWGGGGGRLDPPHPK